MAEKLNDMNVALERSQGEQELTINNVIRGGSGSGGTTPSVSAHNILSTTHSDTLVTATTPGSILRVNAASKWVELPIGAAGYVLTSDGTNAEWTTPPGITHPQVMSRASLRP